MKDSESHNSRSSLVEYYHNYEREHKTCIMEDAQGLIYRIAGNDVVNKLWDCVHGAVGARKLTRIY